MGSYRIEESPNKRAGCSVKACKDKGIKIQKGEIRLGTWVENERFQSWSWRHWGCVTPKVLQNILGSIGEDGELKFDMLDGFEDMSAESQDKVQKAIETGEIADVDKTEKPDEPVAEDAPEETEKTTKSSKTDNKSKPKKRSRAESEEVEEKVSSKKTRKTKSKVAVKEEDLDETPPKRGKSRKTAEQLAEEPKKSARKTKKTASADNEGDAQEAGVKPPAKKARGKQTTSETASTANGDKPKRGRPKKKVVDEGEEE